MGQIIKPVLTIVGEIWGRDAIYVDQVKVINESTVEITGEFNGSLCSNLEDGIDKKYQIIFKFIRLFKMIEIDLNKIEYQSSFDEIINSEQLLQMIKDNSVRQIGKIDESFKHYVFRTYDCVFEIIGKEFDLNLID